MIEDQYVYLTGEWLTEGVQRMKLAEVTEYGGVYVHSVAKNGKPWKRYAYRGWFWTEEEARAAVEKRRLRRVASLKKQLAKIEAMSFA